LGRYGVKRLLQALVTLWVLSLAVFLSVRVTGDAAAVLVGPEGTPAQYEQVKTSLGLDRPLVVQYASFVADIVRGDFGRSYITGRPVREMLLERLPATAQLAFVAFGLSVLVGIPLGVLSAVKRESAVDVFGKFFAVVGMAAPSFWVAIMLVFVFSAVLQWLPAFGTGDATHFILPAFALGWHGLAGLVRLTRSSMLEVLDADYVRFARAKGLPERLVIWRHALSNAVIPLITYSGLMLAGLLSGSVVVEVVFAWPGIGRLMLQGVNQRDYLVVQAVVLVAGAFYIASAFLVDVLSGVANPRIRNRT
jgi:peptide/nickel transport system permease protein